MRAQSPIAHVGLGHERTAILGHLHPFDEEGHARADGAHNSAASEAATVHQLDAIDSSCDDALVEEDGDAGGAHLLFRERSKFRSDFRKDVIAGVHEGDRDLVGRDVRVEPRTVTHQIVDLAGDFDAAEAGADNEEAQIATALRRIVRHLGILELLDDVRSQRHGIAHALQREGMVLDIPGTAPRFIDRPHATTTWSYERVPV